MTQGALNTPCVSPQGYIGARGAPAGMLASDELTERFVDIPLAKPASTHNTMYAPAAKPKIKSVRPARSRLARLARLISSAWGWLCC